MEFTSSSMTLTPLVAGAELYKTDEEERCRGAAAQQYHPKTEPDVASSPYQYPARYEGVSHLDTPSPGAAPPPGAELMSLPVKKKRARRRQRTSFNLEQLEQLEGAFKRSPYPGINERDEISMELGIPESRVQVWFQNRRARHRKQARLSTKAPSST